MITFIIAALGTITLSAFFFFMGWQFARLVPVWVKRREEEKEAKQKEKLRSLLYYVNHVYRRA